MVNNLHLIDCMQYMKTCSDNQFDLAIVDPPYGINRDGGETGKYWKLYESKEWDNIRPSIEYFKELFRISENQIIWGGNYFTEYLKPSMGWIFWDKGQDLTMSDGELAYTSFDRALRRIIINRCKIGQNGGLIHPTQKPVALYKWLLTHYAKPGWTLIDTHSGSGSFRVAAYDLGFDLDSCEKDASYYRDNEARYQNHIKQGELFPSEVIQKHVYAQVEL